MKKKLLLFVFVIAVFGCKESVSIETIIYNQVIDDLMDSLSAKHDFLKGKSVLIGSHQSAEVDSFISKNIKYQFENDTSGPGKMVLTLAERIGEEVNLVLESKSYDIKNIGLNNITPIAKDIRQGRTEDKILMYLSPIVFDEKVDKMGCFYLSIDSGHFAGYIVFIYSEDGKWKLLNMLNFIK